MDYRDISARGLIPSREVDEFVQHKLHGENWFDEFQHAISYAHGSMDTLAYMMIALPKISTKEQRKYYLHLLYLFYKLYLEDPRRYDGIYDRDVRTLYGVTDTWEEEWMEIIHESDKTGYVGHNPNLLSVKALMS